MGGGRIDVADRDSSTSDEVAVKEREQVPALEYAATRRQGQTPCQGNAVGVLTRSS